MQKLIDAFLAKLPGASHDVMPLFKTKKGLFPSHEWSKRDYSQIDWDEPYVDYNPETKMKYERDIAWFAVRGGKYIIIDVDNKEGQDPEQAIKELSAMGLDIGTFRVKSKSGGYHLYYEAPDYEVKTMTGFIPGVDIRGTGGYVVGPNCIETYNGPAYKIVNESKPIKLVIELPRKGSHTSMNLPSLDDMAIITSDFDNYLAMAQGAGVPYGKRDQALLAFAGKWHYLEDDVIADKFSKLKFEAVPGDDITLDVLMAKVLRDRQKNAKESLDVMDYLAQRFIYVRTDSTVYDRMHGNAKPYGQMLEQYPATLAVPSNDKMIVMKQLRLWLESPLRIDVEALRFKPSPEEIFETNGVKYLNTYRPVKIAPWHDPVSWDDKELGEFRQVVELLCNHDNEVLDLYLSQRAAKIQNPLWTPAWGFVLISTHQQVGKDLTAQIYSMLLGRKYCCTIGKSGLVNDRQEYNHEKLFVILNEPGGLQTGARGLETVEILKEFMSAKYGAARRLYQNTPDEAPIYKIPEIHSNIVDSFEMSENHARFAPILITGMPLPVETYQALRNRLDDDNVGGCIFYRKLKRFLLDYKVSKAITELKPPIMPDHGAALVKSRGDLHSDLIEAIECGQGLFYSDIQTKASLTLALELTVCNGNKTTALQLANKLCKEGKQVRKCGPGTNRVQGLPLIEYDKDNISSEKARVSRLSSDTMVTVFSIRNHERYHGCNGKIIKDNFFP